MEKVWLKKYSKGVPSEINPESYPNIVKVVEDACRKFSTLRSFSNMGYSLSYAQLWENSGHFAAYLQDTLKLSKGDRIAIQLPNLLQYPVVLFGALRAGVIVVNTNPLYTPREMRFQFADSGCKAIVILSNFAHNLQEVLKDTAIEHVVITDLGDFLPAPKRLLVNFVVKNIKKMVPPYNLIHTSLREALSTGKSAKFTAPELGPQDVAFLQYTGGTTGVSKGATLTHRNMVANMEQVDAFIRPIMKDGVERILCPLPLYHIFALQLAGLIFLRIGAQIELVTNPRDLPALIKLFRAFKPTALGVVNTLALALVNHPEFKGLPFKQLKATVAGGTALQTKVGTLWKEITGTLIVEGYGLSEASPVVTVNPVDSSARLGSIGVPVPSTDVKIVNEDGKEVPIGESGEIWARGPQIMKGYWNQPAETSRVLSSDGWLKTGDIGVVSEDGFFKIVDRKKDMILVSGFNVYPNEIEDVAGLQPKVLESAAIGVPDERTGEAIKLFVVAKDPSLSAQELKDFLHRNLTPYKVPKHYEFLKELPKNNVGKILRRNLRDKPSSSA